MGAQRRQTLGSFGLGDAAMSARCLWLMKTLESSYVQTFRASPANKHLRHCSVLIPIRSQIPDDSIRIRGWRDHLGNRNSTPRSSFSLVVASMSSEESGSFVARCSFRIHSVEPTMA
jgi:hypothetical protein